MADNRAQVSLRLSPKLHEQLQHQAIKENTSIQAIMERLISAYLGGEKETDGAAKLHAALSRMLKKTPDTSMEKLVQESVITSLKFF
jgi:hypothetical protein